LRDPALRPPPRSDPAGAPGARLLVQLSDTFPEPVEIRRQWARSDTVVRLDDLNWDVAAAWQPAVPELITLDPGFQTRLDIPVDDQQDAAVLVRYEVGLPGSPDPFVTRFVNEAVLGPAVLSNLRFRTRDEMDWRPSLYGTTVFDVVRGDLATMRADGNCGSASCLPGGNDLPDPFHHDPSVPAEGGGYFYLVRSDGPSGHGTYDTTWENVEGRDTAVVAGGGNCP
jgi:hypothetical protein